MHRYINLYFDIISFNVCENLKYIGIKGRENFLWQLKSNLINKRIAWDADGSKRIGYE